MDRKTRRWWLDPRLNQLIGPPDQTVSAVIEEFIADVVEDVLDYTADPLDIPYLDAHAPWSRDLARGLHWLALGHPGQPDTDDILEAFACPLPDARRVRFAHDIDVAYTLTYQRHIDTVIGHGACRTIQPDPRRPEQPWLHTMLLGWHIHLTIELLRLGGLLTETT